VTYSLAVVGVGAIGRRHVELIAANPCTKLVALADPAPAAQAFAGSLGVPVFESIPDLLSHTQVDGIIVATPNALHAANVLECVARGVPAFVEKPVAVTVEQAEQMQRAAEAAGVPVLVGHHRRHNPIIKRAREAIVSGAIGALTAVSGRWLARKADAYYSVGWRTEVGSGGPILTNLIHDVDSIRFIAGEIDAVQAMTSSARRGFAVEDTAAILLRFANGALGTFSVSDATPSAANWELSSGENPDYPHVAADCYLLAGTAGSLDVPSLTLWSQSDARGWFHPLSRETLAYQPADPLALQLEHFLRVIERTERPLTTIADAARSLRVVLAIMQAASSGAIVRV
jgi:predicted dehydrogenase